MAKTGRTKIGLSVQKERTKNDLCFPHSSVKIDEPDNCFQPKRGFFFLAKHILRTFCLPFPETETEKRKHRLPRREFTPGSGRHKKPCFSQRFRPFTVIPASPLEFPGSVNKTAASGKMRTSASLCSLSLSDDPSASFL